MGNPPSFPYTKTPDGVQQSLFLLCMLYPAWHFFNSDCYTIFNSDCYTIASIIVFPSIVISLIPVSFFLLKLKLIIYPFFTW